MIEKGAHSQSSSFSRAWLPRVKNPGLFPGLGCSGEKIESPSGGDARAERDIGFILQNVETPDTGFSAGQSLMLNY
jgi:hypothetical protein